MTAVFFKERHSRAMSSARLFLQLTQSIIVLLPKSRNKPVLVKNKVNGNYRGCLNPSLTLPDGLVLVIRQRDDEETCFSHRAPVMQDANVPHPRAQRLVQRWAVVSELCARVNQDVIGRGDDVGGVDPNNGDGDVRPFVPLLHAHRLFHGTHQAADVPEHAFFGIPLRADLTERTKDEESE